MFGVPLMANISKLLRIIEKLKKEEGALFERYPDEKSIDKLYYLNGKNMNEVNHMAMQGTVIAHTRGNVPNIMIELEKIDEYSIGKLLYFFEKSCAISGYILGVNPFNQQGVEAYKKEMFRLLGKK